MNGVDDTFVIFGCGGHGRSVADVYLSDNPGGRLVFVDGNALDGERLYGFEVRQEYPLCDKPVFLAIGDNVARQRMYEELGGATLDLRSVISAKAHCGHGSTIAPGCFAGNYCHIGPEAVIGLGTILNTGSIVEHEVRLGAFCHIGPNAAISGRCWIGDLVFIGVGATVKDHVSICSGVTIGAGATVVRDIIEPGVYVGTPARRIK